MNSKRIAKLSLAMAIVACANASGAERARTQAKPPAATVPMVQDWSTSQVGFRNPMTPEQAKARGAAQYKRWQRLAEDPRFMHSLARKLGGQYGPAAKPGGGTTPPPPPPAAPHRDWSNILGGGTNGRGGSGAAGVYPAKFSFDISADPDCDGDYIVYGTNAAGQSQSVGATKRNYVGTFTGTATTGTIIIAGTGNAPRNVVLTVGTDFLANGTNNNNAISLRNAINKWTGQTGWSATSSGATVTVTQDTAGPSVITVSEGAAVAGFAFAPVTDGAGTPGQPSIIAFNQLYDTTCNATRANADAPDVSWAYNTGGTVRTSPVISYYDGGKQVAFVQSNGSTAELVLLRWRDGEGTATAPVTPNTAATAADYRNKTNLCAAPNSCMYKMAFSNGADDSFSSPFVDYFGDYLWVGDDVGKVHKFFGVFRATPAQIVVANQWPATASTVPLSSPIYDFTNSIFVGSKSEASDVGGRLHRINASTGGNTPVSSGKLTADTANPGVRASPMIDVSSGHVYAFIMNDGTGGSQQGNCIGNPCRAVYDFQASFAETNMGTKRFLGLAPSHVGSAQRVQYHGSFDNSWYGSATSDGFLYVCGGNPNSGSSVLWRVPIDGGALGEATQGPTITSTGVTTDCSPVSTVFQEDGEEFLFTSTPANGNQTGCTGACIYSHNLASLSGGNVNEAWTFQFSNSSTTVGGTFTVAGVTFTSVTGASDCDTVDHLFTTDGNTNQDAAALRNCITAAAIAGITVSGVNQNVTITRTAPGNIEPNSSVGEVIDLNFFAQTAHTEGAVAGDWQPANTPAAGFTATGGTGGIIVDNVDIDFTGTSQIYYGQLGGTAGGNAIQVSQGALD